MKKKQFIKVSSFVLCILILFTISSVTAFANSAQSWFEGVDSSGAVITGGESPIIVEHELLTFDIQDLPSNYYYEKDEFDSYSSKVTAEYTFYNPSEYTVTAKLLFPFGHLPSYADGYYEDYNEYMPFDDTDKYDIKVNGEAVEKKIRHTLSNEYNSFELEYDMSFIQDDFAEDDFYTQDLKVTKYTFKVADVDTITYDAVNIAIDIPREIGDYRVYLPDISGFHMQDDGDARIHTWARKNGYKFTVYVFGNESLFEPSWTFYKNGAVRDGEEIFGNVELLDTSVTTFKEFALEKRSSESAVTESDWYNAVLAELNESQNKNPNYPIVSCDTYMNSLDNNLMRWYEYEITLAPGERIVNTVTAPIYPSIDTDYDPSIFEYTYLLSPAKTWKSFGDIDIVINTPYYVTESNIEGFSKTDEGYSLKLDGLPECELEFTLSTSESPVERPDPYRWAFTVIAVIVIAAIVIAFAAVLFLIIVSISLLKIIF